MMKQSSQKRLLLWAMLIAPVLALVLALGADYLEHNWFLGSWSNSPQLAQVTHQIRTNGITPELNDLLGKVVIPRGWSAAYVVEYPQATMDKDAYLNRRIVAANPSALVGQTERELAADAVGARIWGGFKHVDAPDGKEYSINLFRIAGNAPDVMNGFAVIAAALAWLAMALWLYLDARDRRVAAVLGWLLLGLVTGPVGLAVWLITRPAAERFPIPTVCPGCGADTISGMAFCVRCGHALRPTCPDCHSLVDHEWSHCGTCGAPLSD